VGLRLASGTGEQISTNQSFDNLSAQKPLWIDRAFVRWQGGEQPRLSLTGGRMPNPFFMPYSSDIVWDDDYNPEGFAETVTIAPGAGWSAFLNLGQFVLDEDVGARNDQWLFAQQIGVTLPPLVGWSTALAATYYVATNLQDSGLGQVVCQSGNTRGPGDCGVAPLLNDYDVLDVTALVGVPLGAVPLAVMADYVVNTADPTDAVGRPTDDSGYQAGLILGKASGPGSWEAAYFFKSVGTDATLADITDSDFGDGGTDRRGHIAWAAVQVTAAIQLKVKGYLTHRKDEATAQDDINRLLVDLVAHF